MVCLQVPRAVPQEGAYAVAGANARIVEGVGKLVGAGAGCGEGWRLVPDVVAVTISTAGETVAPRSMIRDIKSGVRCMPMRWLLSSQRSA